MDDFYTVLELSHRQRDPYLDPAEVRKAYHRALLLHHPDKSEPRQGQDEASAKQTRNGQDCFSIDQITNAYETLKDAAKRLEYDRNLSLLKRQRIGSGTSSETRFFSGLDTVDLDDLDFDESSQTWRKPCRCGHHEGFLITENDLESAASQGELVIGCRGCSLWLRVLFRVAPEEGSHDNAP